MSFQKTQKRNFSSKILEKLKLLLFIYLRNINVNNKIAEIVDHKNVIIIIIITII